MKEPQRRSAWSIRELLVGAALLLAAGCATQAPVAHDGMLSAKIVHLKGGARSLPRGGVWQVIKVGDCVKAGTLIQTAADSRLDLVLGAELPAYQAGAAQSTVQVEGDSLLGIDQLTVAKTGAEVVTETQLDLKAGQIHGVVNKLSGSSRYEVKVCNGVAGIRQAVYDLNAKGEAKVSSGSVVLAYAKPDGTIVTQVITGSQPADAAPASVRTPPASLGTPPANLGTPPPVRRTF